MSLITIQYNFLDTLLMQFFSNIMAAFLDNFS